jgi:ribonuclease P protein component
MIGRKNRFHGYGSLRNTYRNGKVVRGPLCTLKYLRNTRRDNYRVAAVVSKKVSKSAVVRNRIRRRIYESVRKNIVAGEAYDLIFNVYSDQLATCTTAELDKAIVGKLRAAHIGLKQSHHRQPRAIVDTKEQST